jgi:hypothetical protein
VTIGASHCKRVERDIVVEVVLLDRDGTVVGRAPFNFG